ncbi:MAG TPA: isocitrate lyase/phosphoenolpyruvate mutase family protein [Usitatibacter sp.]|nr:isocitrate lyase/phosphoenolpyruvate mutase family protein [Usitatibacter sp.]
MNPAPDIADRRRAFRKLHESGCFVIPNPWDAGSARYLERLGFKALATTSSGGAWARGRADGSFALEETLQYLREIVDATGLPVNADFEAGYAADPGGVGRNVRLAIDGGAAGISIEDSTGDSSNPLRELPAAVARMQAARRAIDDSGTETLLIGRAENFFLGKPDLDDTLRRLRAYSEAGADVLYAPGIKTAEQIAAVVKAAAPKPVNLLVGSATQLTMREIEALGVRRVSVGGALARAAWGGFMKVAREIAEEGRFDGFAAAASGAELNKLFGPSQ